MKKFTAVLLTSILAIGTLSGCSTGETENNSSNTSNESATTEENNEVENEKALIPVRVSEVVHSVFYAPYDVK